LWKDGWKAVVEQEQGGFLTEEMLAKQKWELYHVAEDFSESEDLAAKHPEKLAELIDRWWVEAEKYNVLPLDSRMQLRMTVPKPTERPTGSRFVYFPGGAPQFDYTAVNVKNRSHTITAEVEIPPGGAEGVLLAHGSWFGGYSLYVQAQRLHYVHNYLGLAEYRVSASEVLLAGKMLLQLRFTRTGEHQGRAELYIDQRKVGEGDIPRTVPAVIETSSEGLCCGYDSGLPVTPDYRAPFRFTGHITQVVVDIECVYESDAEAQLRSAFIEQ
jgi:arylsulfatase